MGNRKRYWTGLDELEETPAFKESLAHEFPQTQSVDQFLADDRLAENSAGRRDFLKFMGFSLAAATLAACETPVVKSIPYVNKPEEITPGVANYYASTYYDGQDYGNLLVKTREGRPIFIKGNKEHGIGGGSLNARINSSVLGLYDSARLNGPMADGKASTWTEVDEAVAAGLKSAKNVVVLSNTIISPSAQRAIDSFTATYSGRHIQYDAISYSGIRAAHKAVLGKSVIPALSFDKARTIVSIGADFLSTWMLSNVYTPDYAKGRKPGKDMSKHYQFEACMSLTGSNADVRVMIKPSQEGAVAVALYNAVTGKEAASIEGVSANAIASAASDLKKNAGKSLVVSGSNDQAIQQVVAALNKELGNYGSTLDANNGVNLYQGNPAEMEALVAEMKSGSVDALIVYGANPAYDWQNAAAFNEGLAKVGTSVSFALVKDETAAGCKFVCPDHHYLESWNDLSIVNGRVDLVQPTISPLFNSRYAQESLLKWGGDSTPYYNYLRSSYNGGFVASMMYTDNAWNVAVHNGTFTQEGTADVVNTASEATEVLDNSAAMHSASSAKGGEWELVTYQKTGLGSGNQAANPWLHELPDPVTKVCWDNYVTMARVDMERLGLNMKVSQREYPHLVKVSANGYEVTLPALLQPGQQTGTIGIALGYGRGKSGNIGKAAYQTGESGSHLTDEAGNLKPIGANAFPFGSLSNGHVVYQNLNVQVEKVDEEYPLATTQMQHTYMGRDSVVKETTLSGYVAEASKKKGTASWNKRPALVVHEDVNGDGVINSSDKEYIKEIDLWKAHPVEGIGHRWGMTIDLSSCIGCGACVTACHLENNVPVVGKDEIRRHRDMHWMRIDRFYSSDYTQEIGEEEGKGTIETYGLMEHPSDNPQTVHMPMMCQHCNHAPCETVCPVAATTHSNEGLNQMTYNRCIGTRYCANNCPYKVRRFNWFNYMGNDKFGNVNPAQDELSRMVLNPDVTVRARGVMEKCSMCVQRLQAGKLEAKKAGTPVKDGTVVTACAESCPTHAITFGDLNDNKSNVLDVSQDNRAYHALEEIGVQPNVFYMTKVRNTENSEA
jgi:MoCo/4Fe-4S cofactor protein with predicted Tat translocation signal